MKVSGMDVVIESPKGSLRYGSDWTQLMKDDYGYISNTVAVDGDELDCFIGPDPNSQYAYIVEQINPKTGLFDEYKVMLNFSNIFLAHDGYDRNYQPDWKGFKRIYAVRLIDFKNWYSGTLAEMYANA